MEGGRDKEGRNGRRPGEIKEGRKGRREKVQEEVEGERGGEGVGRKRG